MGFKPVLSISRSLLNSGKGEEKRKGEEERLLCYVRDIRVVAQDILSELEHLKNKSLATVDIRESSEVLTKSYNRIDGYLKELRNILSSCSQLCDQVGDEITKIESLWERVKLYLPSDLSCIQPPDLLDKISKAEPLLKKIVYHCCLITIPSRVNQHLQHLRVGNSLNFHETFEDELPDEKDRIELLKYLRSHPTFVGGIVDVENGLIYRASPKRWRRWVSILLVIFFAAVGAVVSWGLILLADIPIDLGRFLKLYLFVIIGGIAHIGVDALKEIRAGEETLPALGDVFMWIHVKEASVIAGVITLLCVFLGMIVWVKDVNVMTAFLVGYSADSFMDLFLQRFSKAVSARTTTLRKII